MKKYVKPVVAASEGLAESVYMGSGNCYTFNARITQKPEVGRDTYVIQMDGVHDATHHSSVRNVVVVFDNPVNYVSSNATNVAGDGTNTLTLTFEDGHNGSYHNNPTDNIGLGELQVTSSAPSLAIVKTYSNYCNEECGQAGH